MKKVAVCLGNTCRSPMVEAILRKKNPEAEIGSAGLLEKSRNGNPASEGSVVAMREIGIDISGHRSQFIGDINLSDVDIFVAVGQAEREKLVGMGISGQKIVIVGGPDGLPNPYQKNQDEYDKTRDMIINWVEKFTL